MPASVTLSVGGSGFGTVDTSIPGGRLTANVRVENAGQMAFVIGMGSLNFALFDPSNRAVPIHVDLPEGVCDVSNLNPGESRSFTVPIMAFGVGAGTTPDYHLSCSVGGGLASIATYFHQVYYGAATQ